MNDEDYAELQAAQEVLILIRREHPDWQGDKLLDAVIERTGRTTVVESRLELCDTCGDLYHADYGGEYVPMGGDEELAEDIGVSPASILRLEYRHYCDWYCLRAAVRALDSILEGTDDWEEPTCPICGNEQCTCEVHLSH